MMPPALKSIEATATRWSARESGSELSSVMFRMICGYQVDTLQKAISDPVASAVQTRVGLRSGGANSLRSTKLSSWVACPRAFRSLRAWMPASISGGSGT